MLGPLGEGGFAQVWRVLDRRLNVQRAVKVVDVTADRQAGERVLREAKLLAELCHASVLTVFDAFEDDGLACVVMELCAGSLADRVAASGPLSPALAVGLGIDVLGALGAAHALGVVHRDIKPQNLLITERGEVRVADFGIARFRDESVSITRTGALLGSVPFMAPEQRRDPSRVGVGADLYALATTLAWAMTGRPSGDLFVEAELARLGRLTGAGVAGVLAKAGRYAPEERYASAEEMTQALRAVAAAMPEPTDDLHVASDPHPRVRLRSQTPRWGLFAVGLAVVSAGALAFTSRRAAAPPALTAREDVPPCTDGTTWFDETVRSGPREAMAAASADIDGDGNVDALFTIQLDESLSIYWGNGRAMLEQGAEVPTARSGSPVGVGDLDGDGRADLVVSDRDGARLQIFPGGDGRTFGAPIEIFQSGIPAWPLPIDWDGDRQLDLALTLAACVAWRQGDVESGFAPHRCLAPGPDVLGVAVVRSATSKVGLLLAGGAGWWVAHPDEAFGVEVAVVGPGGTAPGVTTGEGEGAAAGAGGGGAAGVVTGVEDVVGDDPPHAQASRKIVAKATVMEETRIKIPQGGHPTAVDRADLALPCLPMSWGLDHPR